jgi:hypothetical protein
MSQPLIGFGCACLGHEAVEQGLVRCYDLSTQHSAAARDLSAVDRRFAGPTSFQFAATKYFHTSENRYVATVEFSPQPRETLPISIGSPHFLSTYDPALIASESPFRTSMLWASHYTLGYSQSVVPTQSFPFCVNGHRPQVSTRLAERVPQRFCWIPHGWQRHCGFACCNPMPTFSHTAFAALRCSSGTACRYTLSSSTYRPLSTVPNVAVQALYAW